MHEFSDFKIGHKEECIYPEYDQQINPTPRGLVALEQLFDRNDGHKKERKEDLEPGGHVEVNIGTSEEPRMVKIGKNIPKEAKEQIINLLREYRDVLAFTYNELKVYKEDVLQHTIPLKEGAKPFRQKLRQINPKLAHLV